MQKDSLTGLVMATLMEAKPLIQGLALERTNDPFFPLFRKPGTVLIISGIGKSNAAMAAFHLSSFYKPDRILNAGAAGAAAYGFSLGDVFQINHIVEYDRPDFETGKPHLYVPQIIEGFRDESLATQDKPVISPEFRDEVSRQAHLVDMEAASVAHALSKFQIPFFCFKFVTDTPEQYEEAQIVRNIKRFRDIFCRFLLTEVLPALHRMS